MAMLEQFMGIDDYADDVLDPSLKFGLDYAGDDMIVPGQPAIGSVSDYGLESPYKYSANLLSGGRKAISGRAGRTAQSISPAGMFDRGAAPQTTGNVAEGGGTEVQGPAEGGGFDMQAIGEAFGMPAGKVSAMIAQGGVPFQMSRAIGKGGTQLSGRDQVETLYERYNNPESARQGVSRGEVSLGPGEGLTGRDLAEFNSSNQMTQQEYNVQSAREDATRSKQQDYFSKVGRSPEQIAFNNLLQMSPEQLGQIDFNDPTMMGNLAKSNIIPFAEARNRSVISQLQDTPDQTWGDKYGKNIVLGTMAGIGGAINPMLGAAVGAASQGIATGLEGGDWGDVGEAAAMGGAGGLAAGALGYGFDAIAGSLGGGATSGGMSAGEQALSDAFLHTGEFAIPGLRDAASNFSTRAAGSVAGQAGLGGVSIPGEADIAGLAKAQAARQAGTPGLADFGMAIGQDVALPAIAGSLFGGGAPSVGRQGGAAFLTPSTIGYNSLLGMDSEAGFLDPESELQMATLAA